MHKWQETSIRDLFFCKCGLYRYPVRKRIAFRRKLENLNMQTPDKQIHSIYVYAKDYFVKIRKKVVFKAWRYIHNPCTVKHDA